MSIFDLWPSISKEVSTNGMTEYGVHCKLFDRTISEREAYILIDELKMALDMINRDRVKVG